MTKYKLTLLVTLVLVILGSVYLTGESVPASGLEHGERVIAICQPKDTGPLWIVVHGDGFTAYLGYYPQLVPSDYRVSAADLKCVLKKQMYLEVIGVASNTKMMSSGQNNQELTALSRH